MRRASLWSIFERKAKDATKQYQEDVETPSSDSPEDIDEAARATRRFDLLARRPGEPDVQEIIRGENGKAFKKFLSGHNINIDEPLEEGDLTRVGIFRVEFLAAVHHAEYIKSFVTTEIVDEVITAGFSRNEEQFKLLVDTVNKETLVKIVRDQMVDMAASSPDRFAAFAKRLEEVALHKKSKEFLDAEKRVRGLFGKYHISDTRYLSLKEQLNDDDLSDEDKTELLQKQVRSSKIWSWWILPKLPIGLAQLGVDKYLTHIEQEKEKLEDEDADLDIEFRSLRQQQIDTFPRLKELREQASQHAEDEDHPIHAELESAEGERELRSDRLDEIRERTTKIHKSLRYINKVAPILERVSSRGGAERLRGAVEEATEAVEKLEEQMLAVGTTLQLSMETSSSVRAAMRKVELGEVAREAPVELTNRERREKNRSFEEMVPSNAEFQTRFDRYVSHSRSQGITAPREKLMGSFKAREKQRLGREYRSKQANALPLFGFVSGLLFATPGVGIGKHLDKKPLR